MKRAPSILVRELSLAELEQVSGGFEIDGDYWSQRYGDTDTFQNLDAPLDWYGPTDVFDSGADENGIQQGGLAIG